MNEAKQKASLWRRCFRGVVRSDGVCPHCGATTRRGAVYFLLACILIGLGAGMVGQYLVGMQWRSIMEQVELEIRQPFPPHRSHEDQEDSGPQPAELPTPSPDAPIPEG